MSELKKTILDESVDVDERTPLLADGNSCDSLMSPEATVGLSPPLSGKETKISSPWWRGLSLTQRGQVINHLEEKVEAYKSDLTCKVCLEEAVSRVFQPCGHLVCCKGCAKAMHVCPICRSDINGIIVAVLPMPRKITTLDVSFFAKRYRLSEVYMRSQKRAGSMRKLETDS